MKTTLVVLAVLVTSIVLGQDKLPVLNKDVTVNNKENTFTVKGVTHKDFSSSSKEQWRFVYRKDTLVISPFMASGITYSPYSIVESPTLVLAIDSIIKLGLKLSDGQKRRIVQDAEEHKVKLTEEQLEFLYVDEEMGIE